MEKRYQVFVSSTFADLKDERQKIMHTLMQMDCIPAGMELFPAADEEQMQFIKKIIDDSDYYLLLIGGRYGSVSMDGVSYTEQEYEYAKSKGMKVIALLHKDPDSLPVAKSEKDPAGIQKLKEFRRNVATGRLVNFWEKAEELPGLVALSLIKTMKTHPAMGWVRGGSVASEDLLRQINDLRLENEKLRATSNSIDKVPKIENLASLDDKFQITGRLQQHISYKPIEWKQEFSWREIFWHISPYLDNSMDDTQLKLAFKKSLGTNFSSDLYSFTVSESSFQSILIQFQALGLIDIHPSDDKSTQRTWLLTPAGRQVMFQVRTAQKKI